MDFEWLAVGLNDLGWISLAFIFGYAARQIKLPPLVGYLAAGFILQAVGFENGSLLEQFADLGITLLLFTVGLKLNLRTLIRPQVWAVTALHMVFVVGVLGIVLYALYLFGSPALASMDLAKIALIAFALSFSSTVFVVKVLEERGEMTSLHGRIAIGILIMQDIAAVVFIALSTGQIPSIWALGLFLLIPARHALYALLESVGHGELLILYGLILALGGAEIFEMVGMKGDLGALVLGVIIASHSKSEEMAKTMLGFKDLFLLGFFLSIGLSADLTWQTVSLGAILAPLVILKSAAFFVLLTAFKLRARTALLSSLNLTNYSEFGLIVAAIGVERGWLSGDWLIVLSVALTLSFVIAALLNANTYQIYAPYRAFWQRWQSAQRLEDDRILDTGSARIAIIGMGGIGSGAYDALRESAGPDIVGIDIDPDTVANQQHIGRNVLLGDPSDADFWDRVQVSHKLELVMLAMPALSTNLAVLERLQAVSFTGQVAATAKFPDEVEILEEAGANIVFNVYNEAGVGYASHVVNQE
ncbi:MAG: cation:proton antiporter [Pseudomonadales bacterium]|jgi:predicted Kef-type K+ transport protein|nr:cation:proton antiporter [Pseudomonadales bacterium]